jgi:hypothetical protein
MEYVQLWKKVTVIGMLKIVCDVYEKKRWRKDVIGERDDIEDMKIVAK